VNLNAITEGRRVSGMTASRPSRRAGRRRRAYSRIRSRCAGRQRRAWGMPHHPRLADATGVRFRDLPFTPDRIYRRIFERHLV
jgi:hypothetical protein